MGNAKGSNVRFVTVGNTLTFARLILLPAIIAGIALGIGWLAAGAMAAALLTDLADGRISRRLGQASEFGKNLDSTIDFVFINSLFIALYAAGRLATYQFVVIYWAMLLTLALQLVTSGTSGSAAAVRTALGKPTGALQYLYLLVLVAREVLRTNPVMAYASQGLFVVLAALIAAHSVECSARVRRLL